MTVDERMRRCREKLALSMERMDRSFREMEDAYRTIAGENRRLAESARLLGAIVGRIETNLLRYDRELGGIHAGLRDLGDKSRRLASIMDDYLTGRTLDRGRRAA